MPLILFISLVFGVPGLYLAGLVPETLGNVLETILLSFLFSSMALAWLAYRGLSLGGMAHSLGLDRFSPKLEVVGWALALFVMSFIVEILIGIFQTVTNIPLPTNVGAVLGGLPVYALLFTVLIVPINEEIIFRGLLVTRLGIWVSAIIFALGHLLTYGSISEFVGALVFGLLAGYALKRTRSLYPSIIAHMLINLLAFMSLVRI